MGVKRCAYVTLATNDDYAKSALVLQRTLRNTKTKFPVYLLVSHDNTISPKLNTCLRRAFDEVVTVSSIRSDGQNAPRDNLAVTLTKLHVFDLVQFDMICFLDADTMVQVNVDHLFETDSQFSATPDFGWPDSFNSGMFVAKPSKQTYCGMVEQSKQPNSTYDGGDQGFFNSYFTSWDRLSVLYNLPVAMIGANHEDDPTYGFGPAFQRYGKETKIVHFMGAGAKKPWSKLSTTSALEYFKGIWGNILCTELFNLEYGASQSPLTTTASQPMTQKSESVAQPVPFTSQRQQRQQQGTSQNQRPPVSFDEIWTHLSKQME